MTPYYYPCRKADCRCCTSLVPQLDRARVFRVESEARRREHADMHKVISSQRVEIHRLLRLVRILEVQLLAHRAPKKEHAT